MNAPNQNPLPDAGAGAPESPAAEGTETDAIASALDQIEQAVQSIRDATTSGEGAVQSAPGNPGAMATPAAPGGGGPKNSSLAALLGK